MDIEKMSLTEIEMYLINKHAHTYEWNAYSLRKNIRELTRVITVSKGELEHLEKATIKTKEKIQKAEKKKKEYEEKLKELEEVEKNE